MSRAESLRGLRRWREIGVLCFAASFVLALAAELLAWHAQASTAYAVLALFALGIAVAVWVHLYQFSARSGGHWYALGQTLLSIVLTPVFYLGVTVVPRLVEQDVRKGVARWRGATAATLVERLTFLAAFVALWFLASLLWNPTVAFFASALLCFVGRALLARRT